MSTAAVRRPAPVAVVRGIREIPHACACDWNPPDYRYPPRRRAWTLPAADPDCRLHGTRNGAAA
jgi:hypothetical protein